MTDGESYDEAELSLQQLLGQEYGVDSKRLEILASTTRVTRSRPKLDRSARIQISLYGLGCSSVAAVPSGLVERFELDVMGVRLKTQWPNIALFHLSHVYSLSGRERSIPIILRACVPVCLCAFVPLCLPQYVRPP